MQIGELLVGILEQYFLVLGRALGRAWDRHLSSLGSILEPFPNLFKVVSRFYEHLLGTYDNFTSLLENIGRAPADAMISAMLKWTTENIPSTWKTEVVRRDRAIAYQIGLLASPPQLRILGLDFLTRLSLLTKVIKVTRGGILGLFSGIVGKVVIGLINFLVRIVNLGIRFAQAFMLWALIQDIAAGRVVEALSQSHPRQKVRKTIYKRL